MERLLSKESSVKLQKILTKQLGYQLTDQELQLAYSNLMDFTYALLSIDEAVPDKACNAKN